MAETIMKAEQRGQFFRFVGVDLDSIRAHWHTKDVATPYLDKYALLTPWLHVDSIAEIEFGGPLFVRSFTDGHEIARFPICRIVTTKLVGSITTKRRAIFDYTPEVSGSMRPDTYYVFGTDDEVVDLITGLAAARERARAMGEFAATMLGNLVPAEPASEAP